MAGVGRQLLEILRKWQLEFFGHVMRRNGLENWLLLARLKAKSKKETKIEIFTKSRYLLAKQDHSIGADQGN